MHEQSITLRPAGYMEVPAARERLAEEYGYFCFKCGLVPGPGDIPLRVDHIVPNARGGLNVYPNFQLLCDHCNVKKWMTVIDYRPGTRHLDIIGDRPVIPMAQRARKRKRWAVAPPEPAPPHPCPTPPPHRCPPDYSAAYADIADRAWAIYRETRLELSDLWRQHLETVERAARAEARAEMLADDLERSRRPWWRRLTGW